MIHPSFWCEAPLGGGLQGDDDLSGDLRYFHFVYRHERPGQLAHGPVTTRETHAAANLTELLICPGEYAASFTCCANGILAISTNFHRGMHFLLRGQIVAGGVRAIAPDSELDSHTQWRIVAVQAARFTRVPPLAAAIVRVTVIDCVFKALH